MLEKIERWRRRNVQDLGGPRSPEKVSCLEGNEMAHHPMHYGMKSSEGS
jgi:hypothetical protein